MDDLAEHACAWCSARCSTSARSLDVHGVPDDDPDIHSYALYAYLSLLLEELTEAVNR